jgi:hypothetical protein
MSTGSLKNKSILEGDVERELNALGLLRITKA